LGLSSEPTIQINSNEQSDLTNLTEPEITEVLDTFVKDTVDAPAILVRELILLADITSILEICENEDAIIREKIDAIIQKNIMNEELESADEEDINVTAEKLDAIDEEEIH
ncbi:15786_t:CDS:2, partial [Cetraspora pellucida]